MATEAEPERDPAPVALRAQGCISESDYVSAQFLHLRPAWPFVALGALLILGLLLALALTQSVLLLALSVTLASYVLLVMPLRARRLYRRHPEITAPVVIDVGADGVVFERGHGPKLLRWSLILRWRATSTIVLLYPTAKGFYLIPAEFFASAADYAAFIALLRRQVGNPA